MTKQTIKRLPIPSSSQNQSANHSSESGGTGRFIKNKNIIVHQLGRKHFKQESATTNLVVGGGEIPSEKSE